MEVLPVITSRQVQYLRLMNNFGVLFAGFVAGIALSLFLAGLAVLKTLLDQASEVYDKLTETTFGPIIPAPEETAPSKNPVDQFYVDGK